MLGQKTTAGEIAAALGGVKNGMGWKARCPAHDGRSGSSLKIDEAADGKVLLHCFAKCSQDAVIEALRARGLWSEETSSERVPAAGLDARLDAHDEEEGDEGPRKVEAAYTYLDADGGKLLRVLRIPPKGFSQQRWDGSGWVAGGVDQARLVLYRLPWLAWESTRKAALRTNRRNSSSTLISSALPPIRKSSPRTRAESSEVRVGS